jgi:3-isopropylmalate dehydrogenase
MRKNICVLAGDGIGPEVVAEGLKVLDTVALKYGHEFILAYDDIGACAIDKSGTALSDDTVSLCKKSHAVILGAIGDPRFDNNPSAKVRPEQGLLKLRKELGLYANIRPLKIYPSLKHLSPIREERLEGVDLVIYRELTGGIYFGEKTKKDNYASDLCLYNDYEIKRIVKLAYKEAVRRNNKLCLVDKANVLESSRLWRKIVQGMEAEFPSVAVEYMFVDNAAMQLILNPSRFDVIVTSNMFGDILSDEASVLCGSIGLLPSSSIGTQSKMYEPVHGSYPQAAGKNIANPVAMILSIAMMLEDFQLVNEAKEVRAAVELCIHNGILSEELVNEKPYSCSDIGDIISYIVDSGEVVLEKYQAKHTTVI